MTTFSISEEDFNSFVNGKIKKIEQIGKTKDCAMQDIYNKHEKFSNIYEVVAMIIAFIACVDLGTVMAASVDSTMYGKYNKTMNVAKSFIVTMIGAYFLFTEDSGVRTLLSNMEWPTHFRVESAIPSFLDTPISRKHSRFTWRWIAIPSLVIVGVVVGIVVQIQAEKEIETQKTKFKEQGYSTTLTRDVTNTSIETYTQYQKDG